MSMRMASLGYKIYFQPKAVLTHLAAPYGGNRVQTHIYDNPAFYRNELFFTLRFSKKGKRVKALHLKLKEYCKVPSRRKSYTRHWYFFSGLVVAIWRILFGKQLIAKEIK